MKILLILLVEKKTFIIHVAGFQTFYLEKHPSRPGLHSLIDLLKVNSVAGGQPISSTTFLVLPLENAASNKIMMALII